MKQKSLKGENKIKVQTKLYHESPNTNFKFFEYDTRMILISEVFNHCDKQAEKKYSILYINNVKKENMFECK